MTPRPAVVRVIAEDADGNSQGSGTLVATSDRHGIVITNWHVIRDATGRIRVIFPDGFESAVQVLKVDADWDLAALGIWKPSAKPIRIAHAAPRTGEALTIAGYGPGRYREATGRLTQYVAPAADLPYEMFELDTEARNGDSGGPILNARGELAGVLFGAGQGTTAGSYCGRVRKFLDSVLPLIDRTPESQLAQATPGMSRPLPSSPVEALRGRGGISPLTPQPAMPQPHPPLVASADVQAAQPAVPPMKPVQLPYEPERAATEPVSAVRSQPLAPPPVEKPAPSKAPAIGQRIVSALQVLGATPLDQLKTFLAIVGVVSIVTQVTGSRRKD